MDVRNLETYDAAEKRLITIVEDRELRKVAIREREPQTLPQKMRHHVQRFFLAECLGKRRQSLKLLRLFNPTSIKRDKR